VKHYTPLVCVQSEVIMEVLIDLTQVKSWSVTRGSSKEFEICVTLAAGHTTLTFFLEDHIYTLVNYCKD
jgi:hypothetical protein